MGIATAVGLSGEAVREALETHSLAAVVDADWQKSHAYGVTGVPTFVAGRHGVVGAQPYEALEQLASAARGGSSRRSARTDKRAGPGFKSAKVGKRGSRWR